MASSSRTHQTLNKNCNTPEEHNFFEEENKVSKVGQEEEEEEWLKLGLGLLGRSSSSCSKIEVHGPNPVLDLPSPSLLPSQAPLSTHQIGLGLGFEQGSGLRLQDNNEQLGGMVVMEPSSDYYHNCNSLLGWSSDHCNYHHYFNHNDDDNGMVLWPSCQIDSHRDLAMPVPNDSHHYRARSPHQSGLWFTLRPSTNRDENMTVFMVKKYLVRKLGLSNEAEIDISCMGQSLSQIQTLKQVRDTVWIPKLVESVNSTTLPLGDPHDMSINHLMSLLYRKHCLLN